MIHRITYRPDLRAYGLGPTPLEYDAKVIGCAWAGTYAAARWLLGTGHAEPGDTVETYYRSEQLAAGAIGPLAAAFPDAPSDWMAVTAYNPRLASATATLRPPRADLVRAP